MEHQKMYNKAGVSYVSLFSVKKNIFHDRIMLFCKFGLIVDGEYKGVFQMSQIIKKFYIWQKQGCCLLDIHIHHLLYIKLKLVQELLDSCEKIPIKIYLHDYYWVCEQYNLLKNGEKYCGGQGLGSAKCNNCVLYGSSNKLEANIHSLLRRYIERILFISPSEIAKEIFLRFHPEYSTIIKVISHQTYNGFYRGNLEEISKQERLKVAFLGNPQTNKGWKTWEKLVQNNSDQHYDFIVFNSSDDTYSGMNKVKIEFGPQNLNAMTETLRDNKIQIALLWSIWPETYSYTCFEAFAANAFIITNEISGNIADVVRKNQNGQVLSDERSLIKLFENKELLREKVNEYRCSTLGGPLFLNENNEIVLMTLKADFKGKIIYLPQLVNYPLLWILNEILED